MLLSDCQEVGKPGVTLPVAPLQPVEKEVEHMLQIGVTEPADTGWSSPVVLAAQEGSPDRFCVDFRKVNNVTKSDAFFTLRLEDCVDQVGRAQYVSKVDLLNGYLQVALTKDAREVSAFMTHGDSVGIQFCHLEYKKLPQPSKGNEVLYPRVNKHCSIY